MPIVDPAVFENFAAQYIKTYVQQNSPTVKHRIFTTTFGVSQDLCSNLWNFFDKKFQEEASPKHLLWALMFLKQYNTQSFTASIVDVDEKTYRKWVWKVIKKLQILIFW